MSRDTLEGGGGALLASGSVDKTIKLWSLPSGDLMATLIGHQDRILSLAISPDATLLASGSGDKTVRLWSLPDGRLLKTVQGHQDRVNCVAITPDPLKGRGGGLLISASADGTIRLWSLAAGEPVTCLADPTIDVQESDQVD
jgi:hypothetical protein